MVASARLRFLYSKFNFSVISSGLDTRKNIKEIKTVLFSLRYIPLNYIN
jgi:hypothetical protein